MAVSYSEAFKRQLKRLRRRYRRIQADVQPIIDQLAVGETPGERLQGLGHTLYKVRARNTSAKRGKSGGYRIIYFLKRDTDVLLVSIYSKSEQADIVGTFAQRALPLFIANRCGLPVPITRGHQGVRSLEKAIRD